MLSASHATETDKTIQTCYTTKAPEAAAEAVVVQKTLGLLNRKRGIDCIENVQLQELLPQGEGLTGTKRVKT